MARKKLLYGLLQYFLLFIFADTDVDDTLLHNCVESELASVEEYTSNLDKTQLKHFSDCFEKDSENLLPFGSIKTDWIRMNLLRDSLPEESVLRKKFHHIFRLLVISHLQVAQSKLSSQSYGLPDDTFATTKTVASFTKEIPNTRIETKTTNVPVSINEGISINQGEEHLKMISNLLTPDVSTVDITKTISNTSSPEITLKSLITTAEDFEGPEVPEKPNILSTIASSVLDDFYTGTPKSISFGTSNFTQRSNSSIVTSTSKEGIFKDLELKNGTLLPANTATNNIALLVSKFTGSGIEASGDAVQEASNGKSLDVNSKSPPALSDKSERTSSTSLQNLFSLSEKLFTTLKPTGKYTPQGLSSTMVVPLEHISTDDRSTESIRSGKKPILTISSPTKYFPNEMFGNSEAIESQYKEITPIEEISKPQLIDEYSSTDTVINRLGILSQSSTTISGKELLSAEKQKSEKTSLTQFSAKSEGYSSIRNFVDNSKTRTFSPDSISSEELSVTKKPDLVKISFTHTSTPEEHIPSTVCDYSRVFQTTISTQRPSSTTQLFRKSENAESSTKVRLESAKGQVAFTNDTQTQRTLQSHTNSSNRIISRIQESLIMSDHFKSPTVNKNDEMKTPNYDVKTANFTNRQESLMENSELPDGLQSSAGKHGEKFLMKLFDQLPTTMTPVVFDTTTVKPESEVSTEKWNEKLVMEKEISNNWQISNENDSTTGKTTSSSIMTTDGLMSSDLETSTTISGKRFEKNALRLNSLQDNVISHNYKHSIEELKRKRNDSDHGSKGDYELGIDAKTRSIWRERLDKQSPVRTDNIRRLKAFNKKNKTELYQRSSYTMKTIVDTVQTSSIVPKWTVHPRTNKLRSRRRGIRNGDVDKRSRGFYKQGPLEDRVKLWDKEYGDKKIKVRCKILRRE